MSGPEVDGDTNLMRGAQMRDRSAKYYLIRAGLMAILGVGLWQLRTAREIEREESSRGEVEPPGQGGVANLERLAPKGLNHRAPMLAAGFGFDSSEDSEEEDSRLERREAFLKHERMLMAQTWGFDDEQHEKFENAAQRRNAQQARGVVFEQMERGDFPADELYKRLEEADEKDSRELREVLGSRLEEFETMQGHYEEAGLLSHPFEPSVRLAAMPN